ncbi:AMP-dependent synthetase and ligase [Candidatus Sulfotelmatobacter sp. SbA7]|jgi:long-chain acyl-CoA synthetase|nr:AMP-dependent synthetase and ligase [Candidatus Sulfotelmatobacter sp. SbA7]
MSTTKLILDYVYDHEAAQANRVYLTQPVGGGQVVDYTWGQMLDQARRMATHLKDQGFAPGARIAILSKNCAHFIMAELAIWMAGGTTVAIFPTEAASNVRFVLEHSEASLLFVGKLDNWASQSAAVPSELPCIALPLAPQNTFDTWDGIIARTEPVTGRPARAASDLAMLLYTSGSTGQPKGVMQNFGSITSAIEFARSDPATQLPEGVEPRVLSYLPLAHCYERANLQCRGLIAGEGRIFFTESLATFMEDLKRARPTVFCSVPRLWLKFQQSVLASVPAAQLDAMLDNPQIAPAVGRKVLAGLGLDEVRLAVSGAAPIPPSLLNWYRRLGLNMVEGYGMTEDFAYSHRTTAEMNAPGHVGVPAPGVEVRLADDGEILVKSPGQLVGYYKRPDLNAECFTDDGFFHTGDLGEQRADGQLRIIGRKKELFKTAKGKYVAPAPIENCLSAHPMVELVMVSGVGQRAPYAVLVLAEQLRSGLADPAVRAQVDVELRKLLHDVNQNLTTYEQLQFLVVAPEPWSIENGCLTPTMKIKRSRIETSVAEQVESWYERQHTVLWA